MSNTSASTSSPPLKRISRATIEAYKSGCLCMAYGDHEFGELIRLQEENDKLTGYDNTNEPRSDAENSESEDEESNTSASISKKENHTTQVSSTPLKKPKRIHPAEIKAFRSGCACFPNHEAAAEFAAQIKAQEEKDKLKGYDPADYESDKDEELC